MAVNVFKDTTFNQVLESWWDGSETPKELATIIRGKTSIKEPGEKAIVLEVDTGKWYTYLKSLDASEAGWYDSEGTKKA